MEESKGGYGYGKKPWWFWLLVYVVIGGILYWAIYYFGYAKKSGGYQYPGTGSQQQNPGY